MSGANGEDSNQQQDGFAGNSSLSERFAAAVSSLGQSSSSGGGGGLSHDEIITELLQIQEQAARLALFSKNESLYEISTGSLAFVPLEHYLAMAYMQLPTLGISEMHKRQQYLHMACHCWIEFLQKLANFSTNNDNYNDNDASTIANANNVGLSRDEKQQYHDLVEITDELLRQQQSSSNSNNTPSQPSLPPPVNRDIKIARYKMKQDANNERKKLQSLQDRRNRIGIGCNDEMDGYDDDSLRRALALLTIQICKVEAFDEWTNVIRELPIVATMVQQQQSQQAQSSRYDNHHHRQSSSSQQQNRNGPAQPPSNDRGPLTVTHITQDTITGQLNIKKEEIRAGVFRPGWNQPTMSLEELANREVAAAMEREERQKQAEELSKDAPQRYERLVKNEQEDNIDLVDASAVLDRQWDDWKDENPTGSGNKRGDVGDRNF